MPKPVVPSASAANSADEIIVIQNGVRKIVTIGQLGMRVEEYTGETNAGGNATVVFSEPFASTPIAFAVPVIDGGSIVFGATGATTASNVVVNTVNGNEPFRVIVIGN